MPKIKICGLKNLEDIKIVNEFLPEYIGFVFAESKRKVSFETAKNLKEKLSKKIAAVGVFVNENPEYIKKLCDEQIIDFIQLHADEDESYIKNLKSLVKTPIIKVFRISNNFSFKETIADKVLFDTYNKDSYGGTGKNFNWEILKTYKKPYFLAGGINSENVEKAITMLNPYCLDISSAVETNNRKDSFKIKKIIENVRSCNYE